MTNLSGGNLKVDYNKTVEMPREEERGEVK
jgi:hypothetical protein